MFTAFPTLKAATQPAVSKAKKTPKASISKSKPKEKYEVIVMKNNPKKVVWELMSAEKLQAILATNFPERAYGAAESEIFDRFGSYVVLMGPTSMKRVPEGTPKSVIDAFREQNLNPAFARATLFDNQGKILIQGFMMPRNFVTSQIHQTVPGTYLLTHNLRDNPLVDCAVSNEKSVLTGSAELEDLSRTMIEIPRSAIMTPAIMGTALYLRLVRTETGWHPIAVSGRRIVTEKNFLTSDTPQAKAWRECRAPRFRELFDNAIDRDLCLKFLITTPINNMGTKQVLRASLVLFISADRGGLPLEATELERVEKRLIRLGFKASIPAEVREPSCRFMPRFTLEQANKHLTTGFGNAPESVHITYLKQGIEYNVRVIPPERRRAELLINEAYGVNMFLIMVYYALAMIYRKWIVGYEGSNAFCFEALNPLTEQRHNELFRTELVPFALANTLPNNKKVVFTTRSAIEIQNGPNQWLIDLDTSLETAIKLIIANCWDALSPHHQKLSRTDYNFDEIVKVSAQLIRKVLKHPNPPKTWSSVHYSEFIKQIPNHSRAK